MSLRFFPIILLFMVALTGCTSEEEKVVETWEELGELIDEHRDDCEALAEALEEFEGENADVFSSDLRPLYEEIEDDPDLRFRMERAMAHLETQPFECGNDPAVQAAASSLFGDLLGEENSEE